MRVLIVSPDVDERSRAASALELQEGMEVVEVAGGGEAAGLLREHEFDVLVIDGDLRPKGGYSWLYELREQAELHETHRPPAIVMTDRTDDRFLAEWCSAEATVRKPVDAFEVARQVTALGAAV